MKKKNNKFLDHKILGLNDINKNKTFIGIAEKYVKDLKKRKTRSEENVISFLDKRKEDYIFLYIIYVDNKNIIKTFYIADFYIPRLNLIIEVDGGYHNDEVLKLKDKDRDKYLKNKKYNICRINNKDTSNENIIKNKIYLRK